jgi:hypothetical protein
MEKKMKRTIFSLVSLMVVLVMVGCAQGSAQPTATLLPTALPPTGTTPSEYYYPTATEQPTTLPPTATSQPTAIPVTPTPQPTPTIPPTASILEFDTMVGLPQTYTGHTNPVRGLDGGGLPWVVSSASGKLQANGDLMVNVSGLIIPADNAQAQSQGVAGTNPFPEFKAVVSCLTMDSNGSVATMNLETNTFPATTAGDAQVSTSVNLPDPCIAPIIFITSPTNLWFAATGSASSSSSTVLKFDTMAGLYQPYTGNTNPVRGLDGGGLPWVISTGSGQLSANGDLSVDVTGLIIPANNTQAQSAGVAGTNPIPDFKAVVSCLSVDSSGAVTTTNVESGAVTATTTGDSQISATATLPSPCIAPVIFVTSPTNLWFAATGAAISPAKLMLEFDTMAGLPQAYTGSTNPMRGLDGGGLPWVLTSASGKLMTNGDLSLSVTGLIIPADNAEAQSKGVAGTNPIPDFKAVVSCLTMDSSGAVSTMNVATDAFPATTKGDAQATTNVTLPDPCIAPIVFVTDTAGAWFAATGFNASSSSVALQFDTMAGLYQPYTGNENPVRGLDGGGLPWVISKASGELMANGTLTVDVTGLIIPANNTQAQKAGVAGTNPIPDFKAVVSCLTMDPSGAVTTSNVESDTFTATTTGDGQISANVKLPATCIAPIVFITSPTNLWFAATGR